MLKKILSLLLCAILLTSLAACTPGGGENTNTDSQGSSTGSNATNNQTVQGYDENQDHIFFATDIKNHSIVIFDLSLANGNFENLANGDQCVVWEWDADEDKNCKGNAGGGIDSAKLRYSPYYEKDVVIATSSGGWAAVIDYEKRTVLWEYSPNSGNFHSIEMMPNGDIVIAGSGEDGKIYYVPLSAGEVRPSHTISSPWGHGVSYDPQNEWLWVLDYDEVYACSVTGYGTADAKLSRIGGISVSFKLDNDGHVLSPVYGEPGKYWVTTSKQAYLFDSEAMTLTDAPSRYNSKTIKGIAYFPDQTMVQTIAESGDATTDWSCGEIRIVTMEMSTGKVQKLVSRHYDIGFTDREFYKVHPVNKDYQ